MNHQPFRFAWRFWLVAFVLGGLVDFLFWRKPVGISFPLWVFLVLAGGLFLGLGEGQRPHPRTLLLMLVTLAAALVTALRNEELTRLLNAVLALGLLLLLADTYRNGFWLFYRLGDYLKTLWRLIGAALADPFRLGKVTALSNDGENEPFGRRLWRRVLPILRGLVLALPVVIVLGALLSSADPIFADWMKNLLKVFALDHPFELFFRLFYILVFTYLFAGLLTHAIHPRREAPQPNPRQGWFTPFLGALESGVVLFCVDLLFLVFVIIQFRYFFGGQANISETGYTYSEYARRGFGELVAVAVLSLLLYLALASITRLDTPPRRRSFTVLSVFLIAMVLVMLVSAFQRLWLYEAAYGFTRLRTYTHVFIPWLGALLAAVIVFEIIQQRGRFGLAFLIFNIGFVLTLGALNVDGFIARQNIARTLQGEELDAEYLSQLSNDIVPILYREFHNPALAQDTRDQLGGELSCRTARLLEEEKRPWQAFHFSDQVARKLLFARHTEWQAYPIQRMYNSLQVTVNGQTRNCTMSFYGWD